MSYIPILCFIAGLFTGVAVTVLGLYLGFKASFDIRNTREGIANDTGLLKDRKDPAEFQLIDDKG